MSKIVDKKHFCLPFSIKKSLDKSHFVCMKTLFLSARHFVPKFRTER